MTPHPLSAPRGWSPAGATPRAAPPPLLPPGAVCQVLAATSVPNGWLCTYREVAPAGAADITLGNDAKPVEAPNSDRYTALIPIAFSPDLPETDALILVFDAPASDHKWGVPIPKDGADAGDCCGEQGATGGYGSILGMGPADCVEFSSPGGVGRCSNVLPFAVRGAWDAAHWIASATVGTPLGPMTLDFSVVEATSTPVLVGTFPSASSPVGDVAFKLATVGSHCAIFVTTDRRICTEAPGGPCETNALVVAVCCVPCWSGVTDYCDIPTWWAHFPRSLVSVATGVIASPYDYCGIGCTGTGGTTICCSSNFTLSLAWNAAHTAIIATLSWATGTFTSYETVSVVSWVPFHAKVVLAAAACGAAVGSVIEIWQANGTEGSAGVAMCYALGPQPPVLCANCPDGVAVQAWTANLCCLTQGVAGPSQPTMAYAGSCTWESPDGFVVTATGGKLRLTWPGVGAVPYYAVPYYEADIPADCCSTVTLTRVVPAVADDPDYGEYLPEGCLPLFPAGAVKKWPDTIALVPYGECGRPPCDSPCSGGAPLSYGITIPASGYYASAGGTWTIPYRASTGKWEASKDGWTAEWTPGLSSGTLHVYAINDPTGKFFTYEIGMSDCCTRSGGVTLIDNMPAMETPPTIPSDVAVTATGGCSCTEPPPPPCDVEGCPDGAAPGYEFAIASGGTGIFAGLGGFSYQALNSGGFWTGGATTPGSSWQAAYVPGNPGVLTMRDPADPTVRYVKYSIVFGKDGGCCGEQTSWAIIEQAGSGTPPGLGDANSLADCDCGEWTP